jgi:hypothetical protein
LDIQPNDVVVIAVIRVVYDEDGNRVWEAPTDVLDLVKAEVARHRGPVAATPPPPQLQLASFLMNPARRRDSGPRRLLRLRHGHGVLSV